MSRIPGAAALLAICACGAVNREVAVEQRRVEEVATTRDVSRQVEVRHHKGALDWRPYTIKLSDQREIAAEQATMEVPERRSVRESRTIQVNLIRLRSRDVSSDNRPLVYLDGAPDTAPSSVMIQVASLYAFFDTLRASRDIILMDYRGSGLSAPLPCPAIAEMPIDLYASREAGLRFFAAQARACANSARAAGIDLLGYTWAEVAADVNALRDALGVPRIDLLGFSSGTHASLATVKRFGGAIGRVVLIGTEGLDHTQKLPLSAERTLAGIGALVRADTALSRQMPNFVGTVRTVLERAEQQPYLIRVRRPAGDSITVPVGRYGLSYVAAKSLSGPREWDFLVQLFGKLANGDLSVLAQTVRRTFARPGAPNGLVFLMDGSAGTSPARAARIRHEAARALLGDAPSFPYPDIAAAWGYADAGEAYRAHFRTRLEALFITGEMDGNTPPAQAEEVRASFERSVHLVLPSAGHSTPFRVPGVARTIGDFLDGRKVSDTRFTVPSVRLSPLSR